MDATRNPNDVSEPTYQTRRSNICDTEQDMRPNCAERRHILDGNLPLDIEQRQRVADSLKQRRWSELDRVLYIRAASGCKASRDQLINRGLWYNGVNKGGR